MNKTPLDVVIDPMRYIRDMTRSVEKAETDADIVFWMERMRAELFRAIEKVEDIMRETNEP